MLHHTGRSLKTNQGSHVSMIEPKLAELNLNMNFSNRGKADNKITVSRKYGWRFDNTLHQDRVAFMFRDKYHCDYCNAKDQLTHTSRDCRGEIFVFVLIA